MTAFALPPIAHALNLVRPSVDAADELCVCRVDHAPFGRPIEPARRHAPANERSFAVGLGSTIALSFDVARRKVERAPLGAFKSP